MILQKYKLIDFAIEPETNIHTIYAPQNAVLLTITSLPDGIYVYLACPAKVVMFSAANEEVNNDVPYSFAVIQLDKEIPKNAKFITVLSEQFDMGPDEHGIPRTGTVVFPIFQLLAS